MAQKKMQQRIFDTDRRIRLGIWGLGRGMSFFNTCKFLNIDVVAGCDYNAHMRESFLKACPEAFVTDNEDEFLKQDFDAVLLATFCPAHGPHAIKCLQANKHVLSEVTSFFTMAEGVQLVEEVEKRNLVYNLAENYPFSAANMWLANRWSEGLFGELIYAEYEYVHECRMLSYTYIDGLPVQPGHTVHNWRSWFSFHYYCTHSLGPVMVITGTRPTMVEAFPCKPRIAGYLRGQGAENGTMTPSLIQMDNGSIVRNLMGAATSDSHTQRIWGTRGAYEIGQSGTLLRLGASGGSPMMNVNPHWEGLGEIAEKTGHGGGDFWVLYYFAREILYGEKGPFDIYGGCDVTIPGIQALRSSLEGGKPMEVPDFRKKADRDRYRNDDWQQERYDTRRGVFGGRVPTGTAANFSTIMKNMTSYAPMYRAYADWKKVQDVLLVPAQFLDVAQKLLDNYKQLSSTYKEARQIINDYPDSDGANVLQEMLELGDEQQVLKPEFLTMLKKDVTRLKRKYWDGSKMLTVFEASKMLSDKKAVTAAVYPQQSVSFKKIPYDEVNHFIDIRGAYEDLKNKDGLVYARGFYTAKNSTTGTLKIGVDGPYKLFLNKKEICCNEKATNPIFAPIEKVKINLKKGKNEIMIAMRTNRGNAWGFQVKIAK